MDGISKYQCDQSKGMSICERCYHRFDEHYVFEYSASELIVCPTSASIVQAGIKAAVDVVKTVSSMVKDGIKHILDNDEYVLYLTGDHSNIETRFVVVESQNHPGYCIREYDVQAGMVLKNTIEYPHVSKYVVDEACRAIQVKAGLNKILAIADTKNSTVLKKI